MSVVDERDLLPQMRLCGVCATRCASPGKAICEDCWAIMRARWRMMSMRKSTAA